jgi:hypothetical protein
MAALKRVLSIGYDFEDGRVQNTRFHQPDSALGHDLIYWDPSGLARGYGVSERQLDSSPLIEGSAVARLENDIERRSAEFQEHLAGGKPMIVAVPPPRKLILTKDSLGMGTGPFTPKHTVDLASLLPTRVSLIAARGKAFERVAGDPFTRFWNLAEQVSFYESYFRETPGTPLVGIAGTNRIVGAAVQAHVGIVLYIPRIPEGITYGDGEIPPADEEADDNAAQVDYLNRAWELCQHFSGSVVVPDWSNSFQLPGEGGSVRAITAAEGRIRRARDAMQKREQELRELRERKVLFTGTGPALEKAVDQALQALGFEVEVGAPGRTDRIARRKRSVAVVEVKGKTKSASEKDAAQLEKWVSDYHAEHGRSPKGVLVVNAWRGKTLDEREGLAAFPDQMLPYAAEQRKQCLVTGLQLLGLWLEVDEHPARAGKLALSLLKCEGIFPRHGDWSDFLDYL